MLAFTTSAQEHLTFKGVPIDGQLNSFGKKLEKQGFSKDSFSDCYNYLKGDLGGYNCNLLISSTMQTETAYKVQADLQTYDHSQAYDELKQTLDVKYGEVETSTTWEFFNRIVHIKQSIYKIPQGQIVLSLYNYIFGNDRICLVYTDEINGKLAKQEEANQRYNDL